MHTEEREAWQDYGGAGGGGSDCRFPSSAAETMQTWGLDVVFVVS